MRQETLQEFNRARFSRYGEKVVQANAKALDLGREAARESGLLIGQIADPIPPEYEQLFLNGNEAICLGAAAAGVEFYIGYPISPATTILVWMENNLVGSGKFAYQASSEIESITAAIGAGYAGKKSMTATAGPGFSLMSEGIGLAWMAEIPVVITDVQRGGPATGLPTKTEQSDLLAALTPAHGDVRLPVIAPGTVEECFYAAVQAFNWAERYQGPVILLSEHALVGAAAEHPEARPRQPDHREPQGVHRRQRVPAVRGVRAVADAYTGQPGQLRGQRERARRDGRHDAPAEPAHPDDREALQQAQAARGRRLRVGQHGLPGGADAVGRLEGARVRRLPGAYRSRGGRRLVLHDVPEPAAAGDCWTSSARRSWCWCRS